MIETSFPELETMGAEGRALARDPQPKPGRFGGKSLYTIAIYAILIVAVFISLLPFGYVVSTSFKSTMSLFSYPPDWLPENPTLDNYRNLLNRYPFWRWLFNSFVVAGSVTAIKLVVDSMAGYAFAKMRFPGRDALFLVVLMSLMVPFAALLIPTFIIIRELGMLNTYWGLILPGLASPIGVFMMRQFIESLPSDLENAARLDGCSEFQIYRRVILPLIKPGLVVLGVFTFMTQWTSYL
ncbi:MAG: carbohydrate ABC transporter permease, partial [Thermomicrobiales bacterium]|nr:carbohydrate ABC transporter permease [Thermomicrobiales bacterium]